MLGEALANVAHHAHAAHEATVDLRVEGERLELVVDDDGDGFDPLGAAGREDGHFGLAIMRERARGCGGDCEIGPRPGRGTRVTCGCRWRDGRRRRALGPGRGGLVPAPGDPRPGRRRRSCRRSRPSTASAPAATAGCSTARCPASADADRAALTGAGLDVAGAGGRRPAGRRRAAARDRPGALGEAVGAGGGARRSRAASRPPGSRASRSARDEERFTAALAFDRAWDEAFHGRPAVSLCVYIVDEVDDGAREERLAALAPMHDGVVVAGAGGAELVETRRPAAATR